jgi:peptidyl-prolyl cis-trans isomerase SDCCAG10
VAMANDGTADNNQSQFFITLDKADHLNHVHTIFGKVVGDTIFNVLRIGEVETDEDERPVYSPKLLRVDVLNNPFDDIISREQPKKSSVAATVIPKSSTAKAVR